MSRVFVDTNVLVYANDAALPAKRDRATFIWNSLLNSPDIPVISTQVLQEYYNTLVRKMGISFSDARTKIMLLQQLETVIVSPSIIYSAIDLHGSASISFWDALIVTAAQTSGCNEILSEDLQDGRVFGKLKVRNPFAGIS
jgi:predicted nucleic acid-binding protein